VALDERYPLAAIGEPAGDDFAGRPCPDDNSVEGVFPITCDC
jgi:hypothetical protein